MAKPGPKSPKKEEWEDAFLANLRKTYSITEAAETRGNEAKGLRPVARTRRTVERRRKKSKNFDRRVERVWEEIVDSLEAGAMKRAIDGWMEPVFYKGKLVGSRRVFSAGLTVFMLKARRPERYRELRGKDDDPASPSALLLADEIRNALVSGATAVASEAPPDEPKTVDVEGGPAS